MGDPVYEKLTNPCDFVGRFFFSFKNDDSNGKDRVSAR
jgi:hypothetical protein